MLSFDEWIKKKRLIEGDFARTLASIGVGMGSGIAGNAMAGPVGIPLGVWLGTKLAGKYLPNKGMLEPIDRNKRKE